MTLALVALSLTLLAPDASRDEPIRVMSYNIRYANASDGENIWDKRKDFLAETIKAFDPDLLGTQETLARQRDDLAARLNGYEVLAAGRDDGREAGEMMAIFYRKARFEKLESGHFWLSETPEVAGSKSWDSSLPRMVTWVKLRDKKNPDARPIAYFNTHFDHRGPTSRIEAARLIRKKIEDLGAACRVVVSGDFNSGDGSEPYKILFRPADPKARVLLDTYRVTHPTKASGEGTITGFKAGSTSGSRIDWIGCSTDWEIKDASIVHAERDGHTPSDHHAITAILGAAKPAAAANHVRLRVLSYNIHHAEGTDGKLDLPRIARIILVARPDLVALQEIDRNVQRSGKVDEIAELARLTGLHGTFGKAIDYGSGEYGLGVLSRFPIERMSIHRLPGDPGDSDKSAIALETRIAIDGRTISFVSTHLHHRGLDLRERQATKLNELFAASDHPVILAGDLNATPESRPLEILSRTWALASPNRSLLTIPAGVPTQKIDFVHVLPREGVRVLEEVVPDEKVASDHRPVMVELELP